MREGESRVGEIPFGLLWVSLGFRGFVVALSPELSSRSVTSSNLDRGWTD